MGTLLSIVTPAREAGPRLAAALASVADQAGAADEHLVVGPPGLALTEQPPARRLVASDATSPYAALNAGFAQCRGEVFAWLNDDEQYLPGTLAFVRDWFARHPAADILAGDFVVVDAAGAPLAVRRIIRPVWWLIAASYLYPFSCATFFRRRLREAGLRFDESYRIAADEDFFVRALRAGFRARHVRRVFSAFTVHPAQLSRRPEAAAERARLRAGYPAWVRGLRPGLNALRVAWMAGAGCYFPLRRFVCETYAPGSDHRERREVRRLPARWPG